MVHNLVAARAGTVTPKRRPGRGGEFIGPLPGVAFESRQTLAVPHERSGSEVLVVDDNADAAALVDGYPV